MMQLSIETRGDENAWAIFSRDGVYRYTLGRRWGQGDVLVACLLNPSTADEIELDPTLRRVKSFAQRECCGGMIIVNAFAMRSTDPRALLKDVPYAVGPYNDEAIRSAISRVDARVVLAGWGRAANTKIARRMGEVAVMGLSTHHPWLCLGKTKDGYPRHPLYVRGDEPLVNYR